MNAQERVELSAALWAARFAGLEAAALFALLDAGPMTRADLCRLMAERHHQHVYQAVKRLTARKVVTLDSDRRVILLRDWRGWQELDGAPIFAGGNSAEAGRLTRAGTARRVTTTGPQIPRVEPAEPKTNVKGEPYPDEPGQRHMVDDAGGALDESEDARWNLLTQRLIAAHKRRS